MAAKASLLLCLACAAVLGARANIVTVAQSQPQLSTLVTAVEAAGLVDELSNPEVPLTVFAPVDSAFESAPVPVEQLLQDIPLLTDILTYHVVPGEALMSSDLKDGMVLTTMEGGNLTVSLEGGEVLLLSAGAPPARVIQADVPADDSVGSVIHLIDTVLLPEM